MVHLNAPKDVSTVQGRSKHVSLTHLDKGGMQVITDVLARCRQDTILMYELFKWEHIVSSKEVVDELLSLEGR